MCKFNSIDLIDLSKVMDDIINEYKEDIETDELGDYITIDICGYCKKVDMLYIESNEDNKNMCYECWDMVKEEKGMFILEDGDELEENVDNNWIGCCEFMNEMDYNWLECEDKWICCSEVSYCFECDTHRRCEKVSICMKCDNGFCCNESYIDCIGETICNECLGNCNINVEEDCKENCLGCSEKLWESQNDYDIDIYEINGEKMIQEIDSGPRIIIFMKN